MRIFIASLAVLTLNACMEVRPLGDGFNGAIDCYSCHGNLNNGNNAPPIMFEGGDPNDPHQAHMNAGFRCITCHPIPVEADVEHISGRVEFNWTGLAVANKTNAWYDQQSNTCANYCHKDTRPTWTATKVDCESCHESPPSGSHVKRDDCASCHSPKLHLNGRFDLETTCTSCHDKLPGAHETHLAESSEHKAIACYECHVVPVNYGHMTTHPAPLTWGRLASNGVVPSFDRETKQCTNYCHGTTLANGYNTTPNWTVVNGTQAVCGTCHGAPPYSPHPDREDCNTCHPNGDLHVNGTLDFVSAECNECHGNAVTSAPQTGAHQKHLSDSATHKAVECDDCHTVPAKGDTKHINSQVALTVNYANGSCMVGCHGGKEVDWDSKFPSVTCEQCHTASDHKHFVVKDCVVCHGGVVNTGCTSLTNCTLTSPELHINGVVNGSCDTCHRKN
jgi:predicted CxxxxCH...CXXCH cytochrome family protein